MDLPDPDYGGGDDRYDYSRREKRDPYIAANPRKTSGTRPDQRQYYDNPAYELSPKYEPPRYAGKNRYDENPHRHRDEAYGWSDKDYPPPYDYDDYQRAPDNRCDYRRRYEADDRGDYKRRYEQAGDNRRPYDDRDKPRPVHNEKDGRGRYEDRDYYRDGNRGYDDSRGDYSGRGNDRDYYTSGYDNRGGLDTRRNDRYDDLRMINDGPGAQVSHFTKLLHW